ncbi:MAG TPA: response regulator [Anaerolineaceae bacterium]|nr:response regulator [Anaerolineaceae bacterium]
MNPPSSLPQPLALVIEDDQQLAEIFSKALALADYHTEIIADGAMAMVRLSQVVPQLIVLDLHIPYIPGNKLLAKIRTDPLLQKTTVIVATADSIMAASLEDQADFVLLKPISFAQLRDIALRLKSARQ